MAKDPPSFILPVPENYEFSREFSLAKKQKVKLITEESKIEHSPSQMVSHLQGKSRNHMKAL
jgi:hypothetical protein